MTTVAPTQYQIDALRTEAPVGFGICSRLSDPSNARLLHASIGITTEAGELADQLKRCIYYGKDFDRTNMIEELGDLMWYIALAANALNVSLAEIQRLNVAKLKARFPEKFTEAGALNRDLATERATLESTGN